MIPRIFMNQRRSNYQILRKNLSPKISLPFNVPSNETLITDISGNSNNAQIASFEKSYSLLSILGATTPTAANGTLTRGATYKNKYTWSQANGWTIWWDGSVWVYSAAVNDKTAHYWTSSALAGSWTSTYNSASGTLAVATVTPSITIAPSAATIAAAGATGRNLLKSSEDLTNANWTKRGTATVGAAVAGPAGSGALGYLLTVGAVGVNDIQQVVAGLSNGTRYEPSVWIDPNGATGTLNIVNPQTSSAGSWSINLSALSAGWNKIDRNHAAVTKTQEFVGNATGCGLNFSAASGTITCKISMPQLEPCYYSTLAVTGGTAADGLYDYQQEYANAPALKLRTGNYWLWLDRVLYAPSVRWRITTELGNVTSTRWNADALTMNVFQSFSPTGTTGTATVSAVQQLQVTGSTTPATDGTYTVAGWHNNRPYFYNGTMLLYALATGTEWDISTSLSATSNANCFYYSSTSVLPATGNYTQYGTWTGTPTVSTLASTTQYLRSSDNTSAGNRSFILSSDGTQYWTTISVTSRTTAISPDATGLYDVTGTYGGGPYYRHRSANYTHWKNAGNEGRYYLTVSLGNTSTAIWYFSANGLPTGFGAAAGTSTNTAVVANVTPLRVTGTLVPDATGDYFAAGMNTGQPYYQRGSDTFFITRAGVTSGSADYFITRSASDAATSWFLSPVSTTNPIGSYSANLNTSGTATVSTSNNTWGSYEPSGGLFPHAEGRGDRLPTLYNGQPVYSWQSVLGVTCYQWWDSSAPLWRISFGIGEVSASRWANTGSSSISGNFTPFGNTLGTATVAQVDGGYSILNPGTVIFGNDGPGPAIRGALVVTGSMKIPDSQNLRLTTSFAISLWVKLPHFTTSNKYLLSKTKYAIKLNTSAITFEATGYTGTNPNTGSTITIPDLGWHHVAYIYDGSTWSGFLDGRAVFQTARTFALATGTEDLYLGGSDVTTVAAGAVIGDFDIFPTLNPSQLLELIQAA